METDLKGETDGSELDAEMDHGVGPNGSLPAYAKLRHHSPRPGLPPRPSPAPQPVLSHRPRIVVGDGLGGNQVGWEPTTFACRKHGGCRRGQLRWCGVRNMEEAGLPKLQPVLIRLI